MDSQIEYHEMESEVDTRSDDRPTRDHINVNSDEQRLLLNPYSDDEPQQQHEGFSWYSAMFFQVSIILGLGVLGIPLALDKLGLVFGLVVLMLSALGAIYSGFTISFLVQGATAKFNERPTKFVDLASLLLGKKGRIAVRIAQYSFLIGVIVAVQLTASKSIVQISTAVGHPLCLVLANAIIVVVMLPIMQFQTLEDVTWAAVLGVVMILIPLAIYLYQIATHRSPSDYDPGVPASSSVEVIVNAIATMIFAYQGQTIFPEIISEMHTPKDFPKAVVGSVVIMTTVYVGVGVAGYVMMGATTAYFNAWSNDNFPKAGETTAANVMLIIHVLTGYIINGNIFNRIVCNVLMRGDKGRERKQFRRATWAAATIITLSTSFFLSNMIPTLSYIISLIGATSGTFLTFIFPPWAAIAGTCRSTQHTRLHTGVLGVAILILILGTYSSMSSLVKGIAHSPPPFRC
eukprot:m.67974 g.67974  ORF g.67974 m.67974 type:complete len:460 (-) comp23894_c0_seq1:35-1414(-)